MQVPQQTRISVDKLLKEVKRVCDEAILANYNHLPTKFANKQDFDTFRKSAEQKFLSVETFNAYKKSQETRRKSIEEKLTRPFSFLHINRHNHSSHDNKSYIHYDSFINLLKRINSQWLISILVFLSLCMIAVHLYSSISD